MTLDGIDVLILGGIVLIYAVSFGVMWLCARRARRVDDDDPPLGIGA